MNFNIETERLILRQLKLSDDIDIFEMDSDPDVHLYIENSPATSIEQSRNSIIYFQNQQKEYGFPVLGVIHKKSNECIGWCGLMYSTELVNNHISFYELGYRFKKKHWGNGYATESSEAIIKVAFEEFKINSFYAMTNSRNIKSQKVLKKLGFKFVNTFEYDKGFSDWFELIRK
jgi:[ribosomal protein S5]-alanine N-acetyltransferase